MAPSFFSCDGSGTSRRMPLVTGNWEALVVSSEVADFLLEVVIDAAGASRTSDCCMAVEAVKKLAR